jgi:NAD(P)-dependent dehydrogenase (short-subunit alcohol dehydrogenase family)
LTTCEQRTSAAGIGFAPNHAVAASHQNPKSNVSVLAAIAAGATVLAGMALRRRTTYSFAEKVVVITGGSRGLGLVLARELVYEHNARVALVARTTEALVRAEEDLDAPESVLTIAADVRSESEADRVISRVLQRFGRIDVLVNNAGVIISAPFAATTDQDFQDSLDVHFWGVLHMSRSALRHLPRPGGRIVNISSIGGRLAVPHLSAYCAGKFALAGLSSVMAEELSSEGVTVSTVYPGLMRTGSYTAAKFRGNVSKEFSTFALASSLPGISMSAERAARQIIAAIRADRRHIVVPCTIRQVDRVAHVAPDLASRLFSAVNAVLPDAAAPTPSVKGEALQLPRAVRWLTALGERAGERNNEQPIPSITR